MTATAKPTTIVSTKGQVILPKAIRQRHNWGPGTRLVVEETGDGVLLRPEPHFRPTTVQEVSGMLKWEGPAFTVEEMDEALDHYFSRDADARD
jgi:AbrB family looped-hinge helix DNA binding protein